MSKPGSKPYKWVFVGKREGAAKGGWMMEHRIVAEGIVGRVLSQTEVVHHKDGNTLNNNIDNLMVFATNGDHNRFHGGFNAVNVNNVWYCPSESVCPICNKTFNKEYLEQVFCSHVCSNKSLCQFEATTKEIMDKLYANYGNFTKTAKEYNVTASALVKRLKKENKPYHSKDYR